MRRLVEHMVSWVWELVPLAVTGMVMAGTVVALAMWPQLVGYMVDDPRVEQQSLDREACGLIDERVEDLSVELARRFGSQSGLRQMEQMQLLHRAVRTGSSEKVALLLETGMDVNGRDREGMTPLDVAIDAGDARVVEQLLAAGASPELFGLSGETSLHRAIRIAGEGRRGSDERAKLAELVRRHARASAPG